MFPSLYTEMWSSFQSNNVRSPMSCLPKGNMLRKLQPTQGKGYTTVQLSKASKWLKDIVRSTERTELKMRKGRDKELRTLQHPMGPTSYIIGIHKFSSKKQILFEQIDLAGVTIPMHQQLSIYSSYLQHKLRKHSMCNNKKSNFILKTVQTIMFQEKSVTV